MKQSHNKGKTLTLLQAFDHDNDQFLVRVGKDRSWHSYNIMVRARTFVSDFLLGWELCKYRIIIGFCLSGFCLQLPDPVTECGQGKPMHLTPLSA